MDAIDIEVDLDGEGIPNVRTEGKFLGDPIVPKEKEKEFWATVNDRVDKYELKFKAIDKIYQQLFDENYRKPVENYSQLLPLLSKDGKVINVSH